MLYCYNVKWAFSFVKISFHCFNLLTLELLFFRLLYFDLQINYTPFKLVSFRCQLRDLNLFGLIVLSKTLHGVLCTLGMVWVPRSTMIVMWVPMTTMTMMMFFLSATWSESEQFCIIFSSLVQSYLWVDRLNLTDYLVTNSCSYTLVHVRSVVENIQFVEF